MTGKPYAYGTKVSTEASQAELRRILERYGADAFGFGQDDLANRAVVTFRAHGRHVRFDLPLPTEQEMSRTPSGQTRYTHAQRLQARDAEVRRRWRSLAMCVKALLEAVQTGILSFEQAFLVQTVLPEGTTVGDWLEPQVANAYDTGQMPPLLPGGDPQLTEGDRA